MEHGYVNLFPLFRFFRASEIWLTGYHLPKNEAHHHRENAMNKAELIDKVAVAAELNKASATRAVEALLDGIASSLRNGEQVTLSGFGTFSVTSRAARIGRNPRTNEPINIPASKNPKFKAGKGLKDAVN